MDAAAVGDGDDPVDGLVDRGDPAVLQYRLRVDRRQLEFILTGPSSTQPCECSSSPVRRRPSHASVHRHRSVIEPAMRVFILTGPSSNQPCECSSSPVRRGPNHASVHPHRSVVDPTMRVFILTGPSSTQPCECSSSPVRRGPSHADVTQIFPSRHTHAICPCGVAAKKFTTGTGDHVFDDLAKRTGLASISVDPNFKIGAKSKKGTSLACLPSVTHDQCNYTCLPSVTHDQYNYTCLPSVTHD